MGSPYTSVTVTGYNSNPPADDGSQTEANRVKWATIKTKLGDPLNTYAASQNSAISTAFGKVLGGGGVTSTAINYTVQSSDQGKLVRASVGSITITTPDATGVGSPFIFGVLNDGTSDVTLDGSGSQTIDGDLSVVIPPNSGVMVETDGSNWFSYGQNYQRTQLQPQGYLTLVAVATNALSPVPAADVAAATSVFYRPFVGCLLPISNGTLFKIVEFTELTLTLAAQHVASSIYDIFAFEDPGAAGTYRIGTGPAWTTATAGSGSRGTGAGTTELTRLKGLIVNTVAITARNGASTYSIGAGAATYLGSIHMDGTNGQVSCHTSYGQSRKWGVWNAFNRRMIIMKAGDSTASWSYSTNTVRASNGISANKITVFTGLAEEMFDLRFGQDGLVSIVNVTGRLSIGIGWNSTTAISGRRGTFGYGNGAATASIYGTMIAEFQQVPALGINDVQCLEDTLAVDGTETYNGGEDDMILSARYMG